MKPTLWHQALFTCILFHLFLTATMAADLSRRPLPALFDSWIIEEIPTRPILDDPDQRPVAQSYSERYLSAPAVASARLQSIDGAERQENAVLTNSAPKRRKLNKRMRSRTKSNKASKGIERKCSAVKSRRPQLGIPCDLPRDDTPMFVYFSFDDAVTSSNIGFYRRLFTADRKNPNGCPLRATFFNSHYNTDYSLVRELFMEGHEIGSHSVTHRSPSTWWSQNATDQDWYDEIVGQRTNIRDNTGGVVTSSKVKGMRAPFLALGGDKQFSVLDENDFTYDASIAYNSPQPLWPFTLDHPGSMNGPICRSVYCPNKSHDLWEVVMNVYYEDSPDNKRPCSMVDGCRPLNGRQGAYDFLWRNFRRHYDHANKVPFGINMHSAWFAYDGYLDGMDDFIRALQTLDDVYVLPIADVLSWMQKPVAVSSMETSSRGCNRN